MSSIKFTSASKKDKNKVTVTVNQLENIAESDGVPSTFLTKNSRIVVTIRHGRKNYEILFVPNRFNDGCATTAATDVWPRDLTLPRVGKSVSYNVRGVTYVKY